MSQNAKTSSNSSFSHAFLPGLILGLIVGAVAGAFLPDWLGGPSSKLSGLERSGAAAEHGTYDGVDPATLTDEEIQKEIDEAAEDHAAEAAEEAQDAASELIDDLSTAPPSDG